MRTTLDAVSIVYKLINTSALKTMITGQVLKDKRVCSGKEDIVINSLPMSGRGMQRCTVNVNIHVPDVEAKHVFVPDNSRFNALLTVAVSLLENFNGSDYTAWLDMQSNPIEQTDIKEHYVNLRIEFKFLTFK
jgi:hypothetical protein